MDHLTSQQIIQDNRDYTMFSWSVQSTANPMHLVRAQGVWFWDGDGNKWLDFSSQLINLNIGHQHPRMLAAIKKQVDELCFAGPGFATEPRALLGKKLADVTGLAKSFFTLAGVLFLKTQWWLNIGSTLEGPESSRALKTVHKL